MRAGAGGGMPGGGFQYHTVRMFTPALDPAATTLTFEVRAVQGNIPFIEGVGHTYPAEDVLGGPWVVDVPLRTAPPEAAVELFVDDSPCPIFGASDLWRVVPVGQRQVVNDFALTLYSIELFRCAFILVVRTDYPAQYAPTPTASTWVGHDEHGTAYRGYDMSGSGGGIFGQHTTWRMDYRFKPALDPGAQRLSLSLDYTGCRPPPNPDGLYGTIVGPWNFEVDLT